MSILTVYFNAESYQLKIKRSERCVDESFGMLESVEEGKNYMHKMLGESLVN